MQSSPDATQRTLPSAFILAPDLGDNAVTFITPTLAIGMEWGGGVKAQSSDSQCRHAVHPHKTGQKAVVLTPSTCPLHHCTGQGRSNPHRPNSGPKLWATLGRCASGTRSDAPVAGSSDSTADSCGRSRAKNPRRCKSTTSWRCEFRYHPPFLMLTSPRIHVQF